MLALLGQPSIQIGFQGVVSPHVLFALPAGNVSCCLARGQRHCVQQYVSLRKIMNILISKDRPDAYQQSRIAEDPG